MWNDWKKGSQDIDWKFGDLVEGKSRNSSNFLKTRWSFKSSLGLLHFKPVITGNPSLASGKSIAGEGCNCKGVQGNC